MHELQAELFEINFIVFPKNFGFSDAARIIWNGWNYMNKTSLRLIEKFAGDFFNEKLCGFCCQLHVNSIIIKNEILCDIISII